MTAPRQRLQSCGHKAEEHLGPPKMEEAEKDVAPEAAEGAKPW